MTLRKVTRRLVPFLFVLYAACYLDRANVGFAALQMNRDLGFSATAYGLGAGMFFIGYILFEVPSNLALVRFGARRWIARIMVTWGVISAAMMFVRSPATFYWLRFLLGAAEAGFFPGIVYYLGGWFPSRDRARAIARFMTAIPVSAIVGGPVSGALLGLRGQLGLTGWQWLFLVEGIPSVLLGIATLAFLPDKPETVPWLAPEERSWLCQRLRVEHNRCVARHDQSVAKALSSGMVWQLALLEGLALATGVYTLSFWLPQIVKTTFAASSDLAVGAVTAAPYVVATIAMVLVGAFSDRRGDRCFHIAVCSGLAAVGFAASAYAHSAFLTLAALTLGASGVLAATGPFWTLPGAFLTGTAAACGIALINSIANVAGFVAPYVVGRLKDATGGYTTALLLLAAVQVAGSVVALWLRRAPVLASARTPWVVEPLSAHGAPG